MDEDLDGYDHSLCEIVWEGAAPSADIIAKVRDSIRDELEDLSDPSDLGFHIVFLSTESEGPTVTLWGVEGGKFGGEYTEKTVWVPLSEMT